MLKVVYGSGQKEMVFEIYLLTHRKKTTELDIREFVCTHLQLEMATHYYCSE